MDTKTNGGSFYDEQTLLNSGEVVQRLRMKELLGREVTNTLELAGEKAERHPLDEMYVTL